MNLINRLQCIECNAFYIGETCRSLSDCIKPRPTSCHPHSIPPDPFPRMLVCQCHTNTTKPLLPPTNSSSNPDTPPVSTSVNPPNYTLVPGALKNFDSIFSILLLRKATVIWLKVHHFRFISSLYVLAMLTHDWMTLLSVLGKWRSVPLPFLFVSCHSRFSLLYYTNCHTTFSEKKKKPRLGFGEIRY